MEQKHNYDIHVVPLWKKEVIIRRVTAETMETNNGMFMQIHKLNL